MNTLLDQLRLEPALAWKVTVNLLGHAPDSAEAKWAAEVTRHSPLVTRHRRPHRSPRPVRSKAMNPLVTADALYMLKSAGLAGLFKKT
ncbi:MAG: hypothetical protein CO064_01925 [Anaerolineae bacterium CG_4_9_14_0_8_um_filter_58_9]|nr:MAG: hypothetical protein CO064_01925 [Anaerolineae bacterium CG_4_9_14_0_8_um_filter_58_9]